MKNDINKDNYIKYSVVIPAHNAETTIKRAINSVEERLECYEIIVVENGSIDHTNQVVKEYRQKNDRIKLLYSEKGVSKARNTGINSASGEWVIFLDADDEWIATEESLNGLVKKVDNAEVIICSYYKDSKLITHSVPRMNECLCEDDLEAGYDWMLTRPTLRMPVWAKLFKRQTLLQKKISFDERLRVSEDADFLVQLTDANSVIAISDLPVYRYHTDMPSVVRSNDSTRTGEYLKALEVIADKMPIKTGAFDDFVLAHLNLICVHDIFTRDSISTWKEKNEELKEVICNPVVNSAVNNVRIQDIVNYNKIPALFFKHNLYSLGGVVCYFKSVSNSRNQKPSIMRNNER